MQILKRLKEIFSGVSREQAVMQNMVQSEPEAAPAAAHRYPAGTELDDIRRDLFAQVKNGRLVIPDGMPEISNNMFDGFFHRDKYDFDQLNTIIVPGTVKRIGERAFADCKNLEHIVLCEGIESIDQNAFTGCGKLSRIVLPASVRRIDGWTFYGSGLIEPVFSADGKILIYYPQRWESAEYSLPEGVEEIGSRAFIEAKQLMNVILPQSLKRIHSRAFIDCGFEEIAIPEDTVVAAGAFDYFDHCVRMIRENGRDALEEKMERCRVNGIPFLHRRPMKAPGDRYWKDDAFLTLAQQCALGSVEAMEQMAEYFLNKARCDESDAFYQGAAQFWRMRAWRYGSIAARKELLEWCEANPDARMTSPAIDENLYGTAAGELLNALGFTFFQEEREYALAGLDAQGVVEASSWESDDGPDEDGFGMEEYYDWWYLNEYLALPKGVGYIHSYSHNDKRCNMDKFRALHAQVAELNGAVPKNIVRP